MTVPTPDPTPTPTPVPAPAPGLPDFVKSGITTAIVMFLTLFIPALLGWLNTVYGWAQEGGHGALPGISTLGYAAVSALVAAVSGFALGLFRYLQGKVSWIPGTPPTFPGPKP